MIDFCFIYGKKQQQKKKKKKKKKRNILKQII